MNTNDFSKKFLNEHSEFKQSAGNVYSSNVDWENCWENDRCNSVLNDLKKSNYDLHRNEIAINQLLGQSLNTTQN